MKKAVLLSILGSIILCLLGHLPVQSQSNGPATTNKVSTQRPTPESGVSKLDLIPTAAAPAGAKGSVTFEAANQAGSPKTKVIVEFERLTAGKYNLNAIKKSGELVNLGQIVVTDPDIGPETIAGESRKEDNNSHQSEVLASRTELKLSTDLKMAELDRFVVAYQGGLALLRASIRASKP